MDSLKTKGQMYDQIDLGKIQKSGFDLSNNVKGTGRIGRIIPTRCQEVLPGDRMKGSSSVAVQFEPLAVPMLANMYVRQEHFYVPNRIVWKNWDKFFTGGEKLDFTTPPPSFSMRDCFYALQELGLTIPKVNLTLNVPEKDGAATLQISDLSVFVNSLVQLRDSIVSKTKACQVNDLCAYCVSVIDRFLTTHDLVETEFDSTRRIDFAEFYYDKSSVELEFSAPAGWNNLFFYKMSQSNDPYESVLARSFDGYFPEYDKTELTLEEGQVYAHNGLLMDFGRDYVHMIYDLYRYFIGEGSNLDYLSYQRFTLSDFYYQFYLWLFTSQPVINSSVAIPNAVTTFEFSENGVSFRKMSVLALRANYAIWYNYYRDQLLELQAHEPIDGDVCSPSVELWYLLIPRQRCWSKDTFTTALTSTGTGNVVVPVVNSGTNNYINKFSYYKNAGADAESVDFIGADMCTIQTTNGDKIEIPTRFISGLSKSKETATSKVSMSYFSLDMLDACRRAQKWLQKALIYGNRPQDRLYTSWGVRSLDARLSLPECLSTSSQMVQLSVNTNNTTIQAPTGETMSVAGDKSANAYAYDKGSGFNRFCEEHGLIISFLTILPEATYPYMVKRGHYRMDKFDYPTPEFATLGMDAIYDNELCPSISREYLGGSGIDMTFGDTLSDGVFGYQGRYFDAKCNQDEEHGELQTTQNMYTFGRQWSPFDSETRPKLNYQFVHCFPKLDMFVVDDDLSSYFRYDIHHALAAERALPVCGMYL